MGLTADNVFFDGAESEIERYLERCWDEVVADIDALVSIESVEDLQSAADDAPFGKGPRQALSCALEIAARKGLDAHDCDGYIGYADLPGESATQLGIIGHVDVVPAGPGWQFEPYRVTRKDGYLIGRGVSDDKGPLVVALHAVKFWAEYAAQQGKRLPYTVRVLFGANEETGMGDIVYYRARFDDPAFLFTPDAEFPVSYGESGICQGTVSSAPLGPAAGRAIVELAGGVAANAVPGEAHAVLRVQNEAQRNRILEACSRSTCVVVRDVTATERANGSGEALMRIEAQGKSAHASTPELGESAIALLVNVLLAAAVCSEAEDAFLRAVSELVSSTDGSAVGIAASDEHFGALSMVGGVIGLNGDRITQTLDFRYPTSITSARIRDAIEQRVSCIGASFTIDNDKEPFLMDSHGPAVQALLTAYNRITGENAQPFVMKGGTYARMFKNAASFGPDKPWVEKPDWVGSMHGPDEGIREEALREAFRIYVCTIGALMQVDL